jgi:mycothiol synthase
VTTKLSWHAELTPAENAELREFLQAVNHADLRPMIDASGALPGDLLGGEYLLARVDGVLAGVAHLDVSGDAFGRKVAELFVHPAHRRAGIGGELAKALARRPDVASGGGDRLRVWSHGDHPAAAALATRLGFRRAREMRRMRMDLRRTEVAEPVLPQGIRLRTFVPGADENAMIEVNRKAFSWHPEQGAMSVADLRKEEAEDWFDADGFFLAENDERVIGFHWTKVHDRVVADETGQRTGEVYVVGVDPDVQGGGLGRALTAAGLRYLAGRGLPQAMLYVESDNTAAVWVYERLGFTVWDTDVQYAK